MPHISASQRRRGAVSHRPREPAPYQCLDGPAHGVSAPVEQRGQTRRGKFDPGENAPLPRPVELVRAAAPAHVVFFCSPPPCAPYFPLPCGGGGAPLPPRGAEG